jgi:hypothetical protein
MSGTASARDMEWYGPNWKYGGGSFARGVMPPNAALSSRSVIRLMPAITSAEEDPAIRVDPKCPLEEREQFPLEDVLEDWRATKPGFGPQHILQPRDVSHHFRRILGRSAFRHVFEIAAEWI